MNDGDSLVQTAKLAFLVATNLSRDALHVHVGIAVWLLTALLLRRRFASWIPWLVVLAVAIAGEMIDGFDNVQSGGRWRKWAAFHDLVNTLFWPTVFMLAARWYARRAPSGTKISPGPTG